jgi:hypothetical protein
MSHPEPPPPPPPEPAATEPGPPAAGRRLKRPYVCGVLALMMAAGVAASAFWPWLTPVLGGNAVSGWDIYQSAGDTGENVFLITEAFREGFSPLFTGLSVIVAAGVMAASALALMTSPKTPQPSQWGIPRGRGVPIALLGFAVFLVCLVNLFSLMITQPRPYLIQPGGGLIGGCLLAAVGGMALVIGVTGLPGRRGRPPRDDRAGAAGPG